MNVYIIGQLVRTGTLLLLGLCLLAIIVGSLYDIWMTRQRKAIELQTKQLRRKQPHITVLVYAHNSALGISTGLASIIKNRYRHYDIVVVNNKSTDGTRQELTLFQKYHPAAHLYIYNKRKESSVCMALQQAYRKSQEGDIVLTLLAGDIMSKTFLKEAVVHLYTLATSKNRQVLLFTSHLTYMQGLLTFLRYFPHSSQHLIRKICSFLNIGRLSYERMTSPPAMYKKEVFLQRASKNTRYVYDSRLALKGAPVLQPLFLKNRAVKESVLVFLVGLLVVTYITYSLYMAATLQNADLLLYGWLVVVIWFFAAIWSDDTVKISDKLRLSFALPALYFFFYSMISIEVIARFTIQLIKYFRMVLRGIVAAYLSQPPPLDMN